MYNIAAASGLRGFIGSNFFPRLVEEYDFVLSFLRQNECELYSKNGLVKHFNKYHDIDASYTPSVFYNLATHYNPYPQNIHDILKIIESNITFPLNILTKLNNNNLRIVNFCSYLQLTNPKISSAYMYSKEFLKASLNPISNEVSNIFLFDTFGSNDRRNKVVDTFIKKILLKETIIIPANEIKINLSDVADVCNSIKSLNTIPLGDSCIYSPVTLTLLDLANTLMDLIGHNTKIKYGKSTTCYHSLCIKLPKNIYKSLDKKTFSEKLLKRIHEIKSS